MPIPPNSLRLTWLAFLSLALAACSAPVNTPPPPPIPTLASFTAVPTPSLPPTFTPIPLAATVNGEAITRAAFQANLERFLEAQAQVGTLLATEEASRLVLDDMIDQLLLAQSASKAGFTVDEALIDERITGLVNALGSQQALLDWQAQHGYTEQSFRAELSIAIAAAWMRDQIIYAAPETAEQWHAIQILLYNSEEAQSVLAQLQAGADFETLAANYDPVGGGDLGWFPQGYLVEPALEEAVFRLQPGQFSDIIESRLGFHILYLVERDPQRLLAPDARLVLQDQALQDWLEDRYAQSEIVIFLP